MWELDHKKGRLQQNWWFSIVVLVKNLWTLRRSNQSILKEINPEYSLAGLMLKLKLQYLGHLMQRADSLEKTLMLGKIEGRRRRGWQRMRWLDGIITQWAWVWANSGIWWKIGKPGLWQSMGLQRVGCDWVTEQQHICYYTISGMIFPRNLIHFSPQLLAHIFLINCK